MAAYPALYLIYNLHLIRRDESAVYVQLAPLVEGKSVCEPAHIHGVALGAAWRYLNDASLRQYRIVLPLAPVCALLYLERLKRQRRNLCNRRHVDPYDYLVRFGAFGKRNAAHGRDRANNFGD